MKYNIKQGRREAANFKFYDNFSAKTVGYRLLIININ